MPQKVSFLARRSLAKEKVFTGRSERSAGKNKSLVDIMEVLAGATAGAENDFWVDFELVENRPFFNFCRFFKKCGN